MLNINYIPKPKPKPKPTHWRGSMALYSADDIEQVFLWCIENNNGILGFEGFEIVNDKYIPNMNWIADLSSVYEKNKDNFNKHSIELSRCFLKELPCNIFFDSNTPAYC